MYLPAGDTDRISSGMHRLSWFNQGEHRFPVDTGHHALLVFLKSAYQVHLWEASNAKSFLNGGSLDACLVPQLPKAFFLLLIPNYHV